LWQNRLVPLLMLLRVLDVQDCLSSLFLPNF
jgi:hypothetical protein